MKNNKNENYSVNQKRKIYTKNNKFNNYNDKKIYEKSNLNDKLEQDEEIVEQIEELRQNIEEGCEEKEDKFTEKIFELIQDEKEENIGSSQVYKSIRVVLSPPKDNFIISITKISRSMYIKEVEVFEDGVQVTAIITMNINYGTSTKLNEKGENLESENNKKNDKDKKHREIIDKEEAKLSILTDGVVRSTTSIIPCIINVNIPGAKPMDVYEIVDKELIVTDTKYILEDGSEVDAIPLGKSISEIVEKYIISASIKIV